MRLGCGRKRIGVSCTADNIQRGYWHTLGEGKQINDVRTKKAQHSARESFGEERARAGYGGQVARGGCSERATVRGAGRRQRGGGGRRWEREAN